VKQLQATNFAFAAVAKDGVVTWGIASAGGDSTAVQHRLSRVQRVVASNRAFAAILEDGRVATWGDPAAGGDCTEVQDQLRDVQQLVSTDSAFAALVDGKVVAWGEPEAGGDCTEVLDELSDVRHIAGTSSAFGTTGAFAATREDGTVVTWGDPDAGGDSSAVRDQLQSVQEVKATAKAFAALRADGRVAGWGFSAVFSLPSLYLMKMEPGKFNSKNAKHSQWMPIRSHFVSQMASQIILVKSFVTSTYPQVVTWGSPSCGGDSSSVQDCLQNVQELHAGKQAFVAFRADGTLVAWGDPHKGGNMNAVEDAIDLL
jgi:hypothetical protein